MASGAEGHGGAPAERADRRPSSSAEILCDEVSLLDEVGYTAWYSLGLDADFTGSVSKIIINVDFRQHFRRYFEGGCDDSLSNRPLA